MQNQRQRLMGEDELNFRPRLHWMHFFWPVMWLVTGYLAKTFAGHDGVKMLYAIVALIALFPISLIMALVRWFTLDVELTREQFTAKSGFWGLFQRPLALQQIHNVELRRSLLGSFLDYGTVVVKVSDGQHYTAPLIAEPQVLRNKILDFRKFRFSERRRTKRAGRKAGSR